MKYKKQTYLKEENLLVLLSINNFIIPEIQREYVWGDNEKVIVSFFESIRRKLGEFCPNSKLPLNNNKVNVGFLYSYKPDYVTTNQDRFLDENLIDGQQRFTSLFLLLFFAAIKEERKQDFLSLIRFDSDQKMCFTFKVREKTKYFLHLLIEKVNSVKDIENIHLQTWFLKDFKRDPSISSMLKTIQYHIPKVFNDENKYYNILLTNIVFWHFKTEITSEGEELYITMNARGESLSGNEQAKAELFQLDEDAEKGKKWEKWQHFFWKNRGSNDNSDKGFNEFLRWIQILSMYEEYNLEHDLDKKTKLKNEIIEVIRWEKKGLSLKIEYLSYDNINEYFEIIKSLYDKTEQEQDLIPLRRINKYFKQEWLATESTLAYRDLFKFLPVLYFAKLNKDIDYISLFRLARYFYNLQQISSVDKSAVDNVLPALDIVSNLKNQNLTDIANVTDFDTSALTTLEEKFKFYLYQNLPEGCSREELEEVFWDLEDYPLNDGRIEHLFKLSICQSQNFSKEEYDNISYENLRDQFDKERFMLISKKFKTVFTEKSNKISNKLRGYLLMTSLYAIPDWDNRRITWQGGDRDIHIVRNKSVLKLIYEIEGANLSEYLTQKEDEQILEYRNFENLRNETNIKKQLFIYWKASKEWNWYEGINFGSEIREDEDLHLFNNKRRFQHYNKKWVGGRKYIPTGSAETEQIIATLEQYFNQ